MVDSTNPRVMADNIKALAAGGSGSQVEANPEGAATDELVKLGVGGTVYAIPENVVYSTTERKIGKWLNDDLYQITLSISTITLGENTITHGIANFGKMIACSGTINYDGDDLVLPYLSLGVSSGNLLYAIGVSNFNATRYLLNVGAGFDVTKFTGGYLTVQYTKVTTP